MSVKRKKERIRKIIEETGYQPSSSAQTLRSKKTNFIGVIIPKINSDSISRMVSGISSTLAGAGYQMLLACTHNHEKEELRFLNLLRRTMWTALSCWELFLQRSTEKY